MSKIPLKMWRGDTVQMRPVEVACPDREWLSYDADGFKIYENSHFKTFDECVAWLKRDTELRVVFAGENVTRCKEHLAKAEAEAGRASEAFAGFINWLDGKNILDKARAQTPEAAQ